jgi:hypothetical protein
MSITGQEDISYSKKELKESRAGSINTTKTLIFKHQASEGDLVIDTTALVAPSDALANGFVQDNPSAVNLLVNKKNLKIHSSRGIWLQLYEDFIVTGQNTIQLIGNIADLGGALENEVFTIYAVPVQSNATITTDHKKQYQEYILADGQTVLNLGREYEVGRNITSQLGAIRVFRNGVGPQLRNVDNVAADPLADGNYQEIDAGNGLGTTIEFNVAPSGQDDVIVVEFGLEYAGDFSLVGDIQALYGSVLKLAEDVKDLGPYDITRYLTANPSEVERRAFGDHVLDLLGREWNQANYWEQINEMIASPSVTLGTEVSNVINLRFFGDRRGKTYTLGFSFNFDMATGNNFDLFSLNLTQFSFFSGKEIEYIGGTFWTNINSGVAPGSIVAGGVDHSAGLVRFNFSGQFLAQASRLALGSLVIRAL